MPNRNRWMVPSLAALLLAAAATFAYAVASEAEAAGTAVATAAEASKAAPGSDTATEVRRSEIRLVLDHDGTAERLELANLHEMAVGESRALATESGTPVVITRDEQGFEIDLDGKKIRLIDQFSGAPGEANAMVLRSKVAAVENGAEVAGSAGATAGAGAGEKVVVMRRTPASGGDAHAFTFTTDGGELPALPLSVEATIGRLQTSPKFQELDEATRAKVIEALRETAPKAGTFVTGEPGARTIVLEIEDEDGPAESN